MNPPRLTIVIPTFNRPDRLPVAINSALRQKNEDGTPAPIKVVIADDGDTAATEEILSPRYDVSLASGQIVHLKTGATDAWTNWRAGAEAADTDLVSFLQDDDIVSDYYAGRIIAAFDYTEACGYRRSVWFGRLSCAEASGRFGLWYASNGPLIPMQDLYGAEQPLACPQGQAVAPTMYFTSWSLSPALAYRNGPEFRAALAAMPPAADIYVERIIPAEMAVHGGFIADPVIVGHWTQHARSPNKSDHLSHQQHYDQPRQTRLLVAHLDGLLDRLDDWPNQFRQWCDSVTPAMLIGYLKAFKQTEREGGKSRHGKRIREIMWRSTLPRCRILPGFAARLRGAAKRFLPARAAL